MAFSDLELLARAGAELTAMFEMNYAPQDNPAHFLAVNPVGAGILTEIRDRLVAANVPVPEEITFLMKYISSDDHPKPNTNATPAQANRIAEIREQLSLTRRELGARIGTSPEQIARLEKGREVGPGIALAVARALEQPFGAVFPGAKPPPPGEHEESLLAWLRLGFDLNAPAPTWYLEFLLHGLENPIKYLVDYEDALRVAATLEDRCGSPFIAFNSCGREIYVNTREIQRSTAEQDGTSLMPGARHQIGALERHYGSLRVFIKGRDEPFTIPALDMDVGQLGGAFSDLEDHKDCSDLFLSFRDDEDNIISVRADEIVLAEMPTHELAEELRQLSSDYWDNQER